MIKLTLGELVAAAQELPPAQRAVLAYYLQEEPDDGKGFTREQALAELEALRETGAFAKTDSLLGRYAFSGMDVSDDELHATLHHAATEWEDELDEFFDDL